MRPFAVQSSLLLDESRRLVARASATPLALSDDPAGGSIAVMPNGNVASPLSAVEAASAAARASIAATGSALPAAGEPAKPVDGTRASDGTFAPKLPAEIEAENAAKAAREAVANAGKTPEEIEQQRLAARTPEEVAADEAAAERVVEITVGENTLPVEFDDPAVAEQVRERFEIANRAEQMTQQAQRQLDDVLAVRESFEVDPAGFVLGHPALRDPAAVEHLVLSLVTQDGAEALLAKLAKLATDPNERRVVKSEQIAARHTYREEAQSRIAETRAVSQNLGDVQAAVTALLPRDITPERQRVAYADMLRDVQNYAERHRLTTIDIQDIPVLLRNRLVALGQDPVRAAELVANAVDARRSGRPAVRNRGGAAPAAKPAAAARSGTDFVASAERRKAVAVPGGGAGSPSGTADDLTPPPNADGTKMTTEQTIAWHRARLAKGVKSF